MPSYRAWRIRLSGRTIEKSEIEKKKMKERERGEEEDHHGKK